MASCSARLGILVRVARSRMLETAKRLLRTPADELVGRVAQRVFSASERLFPRTPKAAVSGSQSSSDILVALLSGNTTWMFSASATPAEIVSRLRVSVPSDESRVLNAARRIVSGEIPVLGHCWTNVGSPPRWRHEPLASLNTPLEHWSRINYLDRSVAGDHKVLWEFNRHQHLITLAQAWQYSRAPELLNHLSSWLRDNPPRRGANWASSLEVAYRSISWCWTFRLLSGLQCTSDVLASTFADELLSSIDAHGRHIRRYLSTWFSPNTHLTGEALGLLYLGTCFPSLSDAEKWRTLGTEILEAPPANMM